jgi:protein-S-isoprenylcysteine O-methyltransferase Ste14
MFAFRVESLRDALPHYSGAERFWVAATPIVLGTHNTAACITLYFAAINGWHATLTVLLLLLAVLFWFWGRSQIGPLRQTRLPEEPPLQLRRDGAFGLVRHPLYLSYAVVSAAPLVALSNVFLWLSFAGCLVAILIRAIQEERRMLALVGSAYAEYCGEVKRFVPWVW